MNDFVKSEQATAIPLFDLRLDGRVGRDARQLVETRHQLRDVDRDRVHRNNLHPRTVHRSHKRRRQLRDDRHVVPAVRLDVAPVLDRRRHTQLDTLQRGVAVQLEDIPTLHCVRQKDRLLID